MNKLLTLVAPCALLVAAGCQSPRLTAIQTFCSAPQGWTDLDGNPVRLEVEQCHLELDRAGVLLDPTPFSSPRATVHVAFTGGDPVGFAGLALWDTSAGDRGHFCLAVRPGGEWRAYRSSDPSEPLGGRGWQALEAERAAGFLRLGLSVRDGAVELTLDGEPADSYALDPPAPGPDGEPAARTFRVGIFGRGVRARWKNFIAGESSPGDLFEPGPLEHWGTVEDAEALLARALGEAKAFRTRPSRIGVLSVAASLEEARRIHEAAGDSAGVNAVEEFAQKVLYHMVESASRIGEEGFVARVLGRLGAGSEAEGGQGLELQKRGEEAEGRGEHGLALCYFAAAEVAGVPTSLRPRIETLKAGLKPLRLDYRLSSGVSDPVFDVRYFWQIVRAIYGTLPLVDAGELDIDVTVHRSSNEEHVARGDRRVPVFTRGAGELGELIEERDRLEKELPDELLEAQARYNIVRTGSRLGGKTGADQVRSVGLEGRTYDLLVDDAEKLEARYRKLAELERRVREQERVEQVRHVSIPATRHTNSIVVEMSATVTLDSRRLVETGRERVYLGIEQWAHPAAPPVQAGPYRPERVEEAVRTVRNRTLQRFQTAIKPENLLTKLDPGERILFALRLARASSERDARVLLEWTLQNVLGIRGDFRSRVLDLCLE